MIRRSIYQNQLLNGTGKGYTMRIAVPYDKGQIFKRFGHAPQFLFYDAYGNLIFRKQVINTPPKRGHAVIASFLRTLSVDTVICDMIGDGGQQALKVAGIELYGGISGNADQAVKALVAGTLPKKEIVKGDAHHCGDHH